MMTRFCTAIFLMLLCIPQAHAENTAYTLIRADVEREFIIHTPPAAAKTKLFPTVIALHGGGGRAEDFIARYHLDNAADRVGMMIVYPEGLGGFRDKFHTWNAGTCCGFAMKNNIDDVGYISTLIDTLVREHNTDPDRIYITGHSNGAKMAYRLACEIPDKIAAIAPVSGNPYIPCVQKRKNRNPVPVLHIHGTGDTCVPFNGGPACGGCFGDAFLGKAGKPPEQRNDVRACTPIPEDLKNIAASYGCKHRTEMTQKDPPLTCQKWSNCPANADVTLCTVENGGHAWPNEDDPVFCRKWPRSKLCARWKDAIGPVVPIDINAMIFDFFADHSK